MKAGMRILHVLDHGLPLQSGYTFRTRATLKAEEGKGWTLAALTGPRHGAAPAARASVDELAFVTTGPPATPRRPFEQRTAIERERADKATGVVVRCEHECRRCTKT